MNAQEKELVRLIRRFIKYTDTIPNSLVAINGLLVSLSKLIVYNEDTYNFMNDSIETIENLVETFPRDDAKEIKPTEWVHVKKKDIATVKKLATKSLETALVWENLAIPWMALIVTVSILICTSKKREALKNLTIQMIEKQVPLLIRNLKKDKKLNPRWLLEERERFTI